MASGTDLVNAALATFRIPGIHYDQCGTRCHPDQMPHCVDCSGLTTYVLNQVGIANICDGSFAQARTIHATGKTLTVDEAFRTPGAFVFQGSNEGQGGIPGIDPGHVGLCLGDDLHTLEARGHWAGVGMFIARSLVWDYAGIWPGITTTAPPTPSPLPPLAVQEDTMTMLALPSSAGTQTGRIATARPVKEFNFVLLEDGARLQGDVQIDAHRHWWAPPNLHKEIPGAQIIDIADRRELDGQKFVVVRYGYPNGDAGTYQAAIIG